MKNIKCKLISHSISPHVEQLYTGFSLLNYKGEIGLSQKIVKKNNALRPNELQYLRNATHAHLKVELWYKKKKVILYFDNHDAKEISSNDLDNCDFYFKRSYSQEYINKTYKNNSYKIFALGLNYLVYPNHFDSFAIMRNLFLGSSLRNKFERMQYLFRNEGINSFIPRLNDIESKPNNSQKQRVLFLATAYNPYDEEDRPKDKIEERINNNEFRAEVIRIMRKEFGSRFYGGFNHNSYTLNNYKDVLVNKPNITLKENYLKLLKSFPICVSTTGLHNSIGWKFAEYIANSKAILCEKLHYQVPGNLKAGKNYLEFNSINELIEKTDQLLTNNEKRFDIMNNNNKYYLNFLQPDKLVYNALNKVISQIK